MIFKNKGKLFKAAEKFVLQGRFEQAIAQYLKVVEDDPNDLSTLNIVGDLYTRLGQSHEAIKYYSRVAEQYRSFNYLPKAIAMYKKMEQLAPKNLDIALTLADLYSEEGLKAAAKKQYLMVADRFQALGSPEQTTQILEKIIKLDPDNPEILTRLGQLLSSSGDQSRGERYLMDAGQAFLRNEDRAEARRLFLKVLSSAAPRVEALRGLLEASNGGEAGDVLTRVEELLQSDSGREDLRPLRELQGEAYLKLGQLDDANGVFQDLFAEDEERAFGLLRKLADHSARQGRDERAVELVGQILPVLLSRRELASGVAILERVLAAKPEHVGALALMADLYRKSNQDALAADYLARLAQAYVSRQEIDEALDAAAQLQTISASDEQHRDLHRRIFTQQFPDQPYVSPEEQRARTREKEARLVQATLVTAGATAAHDHLLEYNMLVKYGMMEKARDLLIEILRKNPQDPWAMSELRHLEEDSSGLGTTGQPAEVAGQDSGRLSIPAWMRDAVGGVPGAPSDAPPDPPPAPAGADPSASGDEVFVPRSVMPPPKPATVTPPSPAPPAENQEPSGPRSLDVSRAAAAPPDHPSADGEDPAESLKAALSDDVINEAVDLFFADTEEDPGPAAVSASDFGRRYEAGQQEMQAGRYKEAISSLIKALDLVARYPHSQQYVNCCSRLGECYLETGEWRQALTWLSRPFDGLGVDPETALELKYHMARAHHSLGDTVEARRHLGWIVERNPAYRDVQEQLKRLEETAS